MQIICYRYKGHKETDNKPSFHSRKLTCGTCVNLFPVRKKTIFVYTTVVLIPAQTIYNYVHSVLYCTHCTVCTVQCVHKLSSQHEDKRGCHYFHDLEKNNTSSQGHKKADQFNRLEKINLYIHAMGDPPRAGKLGKPLKSGNGNYLAYGP